MISGLAKIWKRKTDFDYHKSFGFTQAPQLPENLNLDAGLWTPDQNAMGLPEACTGFTQTDLCTDEDGVIRDPIDLYNNTPPGGSGPRDIRDSLKVLLTHGVKTYLQNDLPGNKRVGYFNIQASGLLDWFDALKLALYSTEDEKRSISIGTPFYPEFLKPLLGGILPMPTSPLSQATWHNWKICGWKTIGGTQYLIGKPWCGPQYADGGFCYVSQEVINKLLSTPGSGAFTVSKILPSQIQTVDWGVVDAIISFIRNLLKL